MCVQSVRTQEASRTSYYPCVFPVREHSHIVFPADLLDNVELGGGEALNIELQQY